MGTIPSSGSTSTNEAAAAEVQDAEQTAPQAAEEQAAAVSGDGAATGATAASEVSGTPAADAPEPVAESTPPAEETPEETSAPAEAEAEAVQAEPAPEELSAPDPPDAEVGVAGEDVAGEDVAAADVEAPAGAADEPAPEEPAAEEPAAEEPAAEEPAAEEPAAEAEAAPVEVVAGGSSASALWDLPAEPAPEPEPEPEPEATPEPAAQAPVEAAPPTAEVGAVPAPPVEPPAQEPAEERPEPPRRRPEPDGGAAADEVTAGLPRPPGPGRAARRLAAERAATQAAIEQALAERAAADRAVEEQVARERARRPAVPIPKAVPDEPRDAAPLRGPAVVVASSNRLRRRVIGGIVALVVLVAAGVVALVVTHKSSGPTATTAAPVPEAKLPVIGDPPPVLAALSAQAPQPSPQALARTLTPLLSAGALGPGVGAEVVDVATGTVLLDQNAATPATPASTAKLLTSAAVLTTVDPESTLTTKVVAGSSPGEVVLVGGGDPTLTRADTSPSYPGAASVKDLAAQVKAALPGTTITRVVVDGSLYSGPLTASGWQPGDAPSTYASPITAAMVDGGRTSATSGTRSGTPAADAGQALATALGAPRAAVVTGTAAPGARTLATVHSAPIARIVEQALSQSDNVLAEALARQVAIARHLPVTFEGSAQGVLAALGQDGVDTAGVTMVDGSGLSRTDAVPPAVLAGILSKVASGAMPRAAAILSGLAVAGYDGTLADRGDSNPATAPGSVRAKTGTLLGVHGLAGTVVTADGRLLVFALLADNSTAGDSAAEGALDAVASALAGCGCR